MGKQTDGTGAPSNRLWIWGAIVTGAWLLVLGAYGLTNQSAVAALAPNEVGDMLAGAFAPLAFFWLVLGFIQQGQELRNSGRALWLQGEELKNAVEQQRELVAATRESLAFESDRLAAERDDLRRRSQPRFEITYNGYSSTDNQGRAITSWHIANHGVRCTDLKINTIDSQRLMSRPILDTGESAQFWMPSEFSEAVHELRVHFIDGNQETGERVFELFGTPSQMRARALMETSS